MKPGVRHFLALSQFSFFSFYLLVWPTLGRPVKSDPSCSPACVQYLQNQHSLILSLKSLSALELNCSFGSVQHPYRPDLPGLRPYWWEASVIPHSITLPRVASVIPASFGLPLGGESVMLGLSCLPGAHSLAARLEQWLLDDGFARGSTSGVWPFFLFRDSVGPKTAHLAIVWFRITSAQIK